MDTSAIQMSEPVLTHEVAQKVLLADVSNILQKAKSGKPLTKYERSVIQSAAKDAKVERATPVDHGAKTIQTQRSGTKYKPLRWTIAQAAAEFNWDKDTLSKAMKRAGIEGSGGTFSTAEIVKACFGDLDGEKLRKLTLEADLLAVELARERAQVLATDEVLRVWSGVVVAMRQVVKGSNLSDTEKHECLRQIRELKVTDFGKEKQE
jgi:hypothetical protein